MSCQFLHSIARWGFFRRASWFLYVVSPPPGFGVFCSGPVLRLMRHPTRSRLYILLPTRCFVFRFQLICHFHQFLARTTLLKLFSSFGIIPSDQFPIVQSTLYIPPYISLMCRSVLPLLFHCLSVYMYECDTRLC